MLPRSQWKIIAQTMRPMVNTPHPMMMTVQIISVLFDGFFWFTSSTLLGANDSEDTNTARGQLHGKSHRLPPTIFL